MGDSLERNPKAIAVRTATELCGHLLRAVRQRADNWHFVLWGDPREVVLLFDLLAPETAAPDEITLGRALGGVVFECGEIDTLASNAATPLSVAMRSRWQRGRHHLLSFAVATQAPALVSRIVTGNSSDMFVFAHTEHTSLNYFRKQIGDRAANTIARLQKYEYLHYRKGELHATQFRTRIRRGAIERIAITQIPLVIADDETVTA